MQVSSVLLLVIGAIFLLVCTASAINVPNVVMPSVSQGGVVDTSSPTVDLYRPAPPCYECMPAPTPAPVYQTIGLSTSVSSTKVRQNQQVTFSANQVSGTPVLSTASWQWIINKPNGRGIQASGQIAKVKVDCFGRWHINLNVRDEVQMLNGHLTTNFNIIEKR